MEGEQSPLTGELGRCVPTRASVWTCVRAESIPTFTNVSPVNSFSLDYQLQVYFALKPYNVFYNSMVLFELAAFHNPTV